MTQPDWAAKLPWSLIVSVSQQYVPHLDPLMIASIVMQESAGDPQATRFEPAFRWFDSPDKWAGLLGITRDEEIKQQATSWGLMQIMGATARTAGYTGSILALLDPLTSLTWGCRYLASLLGRHSTAERAIAAYNAGSVRCGDDGKFVNQPYVDKVMGYWSELKADSAA